MKEKRTTAEDKANGKGDAWTWVAIDQDSKLVLSYRVGERSHDMAHAFMADLVARLATRVQLTTDGLRSYLSAVEAAFGWNMVDYSRLLKLKLKTYGTPAENAGERRYSPAECTGAIKEWFMGNPVEADVCTCTSSART